MILGLARAGAETQLTRLVLALRRRGWEVLVVSITPLTGYAHELARAGVEVVSLNVRSGAPNAGAFLRLLRLVRRTRPDVLCCFMFHANMLGRAAGLLCRVPVVVSSVRAIRFGGPLRYRVLALTDRLADATVANSRIVADDLLRRGISAPDRLRVIPNGILIPAAARSDRAAARARLGADRGEFLWLAVGRVDVLKDYPTLLKAFSILLRGGARAQLRIVGAGPVTELAKMAGELGAGGEVKFAGFRADVDALLPGADAFVMSRRWRGCPMRSWKRCWRNGPWSPRASAASPSW